MREVMSVNAKRGILKRGFGASKRMQSQFPGAGTLL